MTVEIAWPLQKTRFEKIARRRSKSTDIEGMMDFRQAFYGYSSKKFNNLSKKTHSFSETNSENLKR